MALRSFSSHSCDSDYLDGSSVFNDTYAFLNEAFIGSPNESLSCLDNDSSLRNLSFLVYSNGELMPENNSRIRTLPKSEDMTEPSYTNLSDLNYPDELLQNSTSPEDGLKPYRTIKHSSLTTENCDNGTNDFQSLPKWKYDQQCLLKRNSDPASESFVEISSINDDSESKPGARPVGIEKKKFVKYSGTPYLPKITPEIYEKDLPGDPVPEEFDYRSLIRKYLIIASQCKHQEFGNKFGKRYPLSDYVYHELSTIQELNSFLDECCESLTNSNVCEEVSVEDSKVSSKIYKHSTTKENFLKEKALSTLPLNVLKINERLLQERGILDESDLTLISNEYSNASIKYLEKSVEQNGFHSISKLKSQYNIESPSLISFLQHEMSCMMD
ncbi:uncharacterized protein NPIL_555261 [Nephila pilipes]|uniref:Uncharacterized protein n=1 Tax=Nephila pilipes TaxID=299642 RepID=A0A8X6PAD1_NEPPI|nr:uncharacterized protein NPIL_555261 [Nephila pilipes]